MFDADKSVSNVGRNTSTHGTSRTDGNRPTRSPDDKDGFKKIVERRQDGSNETDDQEDQDAIVNSKKPQGLFDLTMNKNIEDQASQQVPASPFNLMSAGAKDGDAIDDLPGLKNAVVAEEGFPSGQYSQARDDISGLNQPQMDFGKMIKIAEGADLDPATPQTLKALVDQIVDKLQIVTQGGITDTVMTIKNPPILAGSELVLTSFDTAKGEFNIAFTNLTQAGKALLDSQQAHLLSALEKQGYVTHIVVTTTEPYVRTVAEANPAQQQERQRRDEPEQQNRNPNQQQQSEQGQ
ncbi:MAG: hypothetical protein E6Q59_10740 [Nitrosomonas sp.]|nr:MAG: hypothetical protein E6Q59_10740 [Nitrosomonas sp.]